MDQPSGTPRIPCPDDSSRRPADANGGESRRQSGRGSAVPLSRYRVADETDSVSRELLSLMQNGLARGKQVHDANIVATCLAYGIPRLLTHNRTDFQRFAGLIRVETI